MGNFGGNELIINQIFLFDNLTQKFNDFHPFNADEEKEELERQMNMMQNEIAHLAVKNSLKANENLTDLSTVRESIEGINRKSDLFLKKMDKIKENFNNFSENMGEKNEKNKNFGFSEGNAIKKKAIEQETLLRIQIQIDRALKFQKEMIENNSILGDYLQYLDTLEKHLEGYNLQKKNSNHFLSNNVIYF